MLAKVAKLIIEVLCVLLLSAPFAMLGYVAHWIVNGWITGYLVIWNQAHSNDPR